MNEDDLHAREELLKILKSVLLEFENARHVSGQYSDHSFSQNFETALEFSIGSLTDIITELQHCETSFPEEENCGF